MCIPKALSLHPPLKSQTYYNSTRDLHKEEINLRKISAVFYILYYHDVLYTLFESSELFVVFLTVIFLIYACSLLHLYLNYMESEKRGMSYSGFILRYCPQIVGCFGNFCVFLFFNICKNIDLYTYLFVVVM